MSCLAGRRPDCLAEAIRALGLLRAWKPSCRTGVIFRSVSVFACKFCHECS